ncbi:Cell division control protein 45-like protein [Smittium culicis]|uniref:Cell division control protein 45-like protein n=1 Tax=Smittium culicis TaxID=133412 RepID=A0A1R1XRH1_9FUNG|nr:Cell division control protein 45-like protein [Smittium culicis]
MVYITSENYEEAYKRILDGAAEAAKNGIGACTVLAFVANDPDALCAARILFLRTIVFINCGATIDIQDSIKMHDKLTAIVIDSHRPYNLYNIFWNEQFGSNDSSDQDSQDDATDYDSDDSLNSINSSKPRKKSKLDNDQQLDAADAFIKSQNRKAKIRAKRENSRKEIAAYYSQGSYYGQSSAICSFQISENLGRPNSIDVVWWAIVGVTSQIVLDQIDTEGYLLIVNSIKGVVSQLSSSNDHLYLENSANKQPKKAPSKNLPPSTSSIFNSDTSSLATFDSTNKATDGTNSSTIVDPSLNPSTAQTTTSILAAELDLNKSESAVINASKSVQPRNGIFQSSEFKFYMVRHWSLENAMRYSTFIISRLATWSNRGKSLFDLMVAKLGLSRSEIRQSYLNLDPMLKEELPERWDRIAADYNLEGANYTSFVRAFGWRFPLSSASDHVWSLIALLAASSSNSNFQPSSNYESNVYINSNGKTSFVSPNHENTDIINSNSNDQIYSDVTNSSQLSNIQADTTTNFHNNQDSAHQLNKLIPDNAREWKAGFFKAYDCLKNTTTLLKGINLAMKMQTGIIDMGTLMLERRIVKTLSKFRLAVIRDECLDSFLPFLHSPLVLLQLGQFLLESLRNHGRSEHLSLPFILAALDPQTNTFLVLGICPPEYLSKSINKGIMAYSTTYSGEARNKFGLIFEQAATDCSAHILNSYFDTSVISLPSTSLPTFIDKLRKHT